MDISSRRLFLITGKMGAKKTESVLMFAVDCIKSGDCKNVTYLCPKRTSVDEAADQVEDMDKRGGGDGSGEGTASSVSVNVVRKYLGAKEDDKQYNVGPRNSNFYAACGLYVLVHVRLYLYLYAFE